ncbi:unnamed protein product [Nesidiocoris tenuis]|uniref:Uncharacterized protein n=1 Tax=Nesidiocoris tenuis TaxID=355587 RepID=A0A6H5HHM9_9HEMI|nr:unnamed protein product [Nesidiocoris tenuis]
MLDVPCCASDDDILGEGFFKVLSIPAVRYSTDTKYRYIVNDTHPYCKAALCCGFKPTSGEVSHKNIKNILIFCKAISHEPHSRCFKILFRRLPPLLRPRFTSAVKRRLRRGIYLSRRERNALASTSFLLLQTPPAATIYEASFGPRDRPAGRSATARLRGSVRDEFKCFGGPEGLCTPADRGCTSGRHDFSRG